LATGSRFANPQAYAFTFSWAWLNTELKAELNTELNTPEGRTRIFTVQDSWERADHPISAQGRGG
jgi:hypothetical protein